MTLRPLRGPRSWLSLFFHRLVRSQNAWEAVQSIDDSGHRRSVICAQLVKFDTERIRCGVMDNLTTQSQRFFAIHQQHQEPISNSDTRTRGEVTDANTAD